MKIIEIVYVVIMVSIAFFGLMSMRNFLWKLRKKTMNKLADTMNIEFSENERNELILLKGLYLNKKISIIEEDNAVIDWVGLSPRIWKKLTIIVDDKNIYDKKRGVLMPHPNKIQKMIDNYIKNKIIPKENILLRTLITIGVALGIFITATILLYLAVIYL